MPNIIIHISQEQINQLLQNRDIVIGSAADSRSICLAVPGNLPATSFFDLIDEKIRKTKDEGNDRTAETYIAAYKKLRQFMGSKELYPADITPELMDTYQTWLKKHRLTMNTISFHMRKLRAVYNKAVDRGLTTDTHPFHIVYTGMAKTTKRAIPLNDMRRIKRLRLNDPDLQFARDLFLFSFYTRGMAFVDMAYLKRSDVKDGVLTYKRRKTGQQLTIHWEQDMQEIADRWPSASDEYLLPIIHTSNGKERNQYRNIQSQINLSLKTVGQMAGIQQKLTMYVARHSWATIARQMKVPIEVISRGMGHSNEKTTEIYLKSIDVTTVDKVNRKILRSL